MRNRHPQASGESSPQLSAYAWRRLLAALAAGVSAIVANMLLLQAGAWIGIETGRGGLQKWLRLKIEETFGTFRLAGFWPTQGAPQVSSALGAHLFHFVVGIGMAVFYAFAIEPLLRPRSRLTQGLIYAAATWIVNAAVVLPGLGEGFAGHRLLDGRGLA